MNDFFGISKKVMDDLENGRKIQSKCVDNYLRLLLMTRPCGHCNGSGIDPHLHQRYTSGGHDDRSCPKCYGEGIINLQSEEKSEPQEEKTTLRWECEECKQVSKMHEACLCGKDWRSAKNVFETGS